MTDAKETRRACGQCGSPVLMTRTADRQDVILDEDRLDEGTWGFTGGWVVGRYWWCEVTREPTPGHPRYEEHRC